MHDGRQEICANNFLQRTTIGVLNGRTNDGGKRTAKNTRTIDRLRHLDRFAYYWTNLLINADEFSAATAAIYCAQKPAYGALKRALSGA